MIARFKAWLAAVKERRAKRLEEQRERERVRAYCDEHGMSLKCPHCGTWSHDTGKPPRVQSCGHPVAVRYACNKCPWPSYWVCEAGFWFPSEEFGISPEEAEGLKP